MSQLVVTVRNNQTILQAERVDLAVSKQPAVVKVQAGARVDIQVDGELQSGKPIKGQTPMLIHFEN